MKRVYTCIMEDGSTVLAKDMILSPDSGPALKEARKLAGCRVLALLPGSFAKHVLIPERQRVKDPAPWGEMPENIPPGF